MGIYLSLYLFIFLFIIYSFIHLFIYLSIFSYSENYNEVFLSVTTSVLSLIAIFALICCLRRRRHTKKQHRSPGKCNNIYKSKYFFSIINFKWYFWRYQNHISIVSFCFTARLLLAHAHEQLGGEQKLAYATKMVKGCSVFGYTNHYNGTTKDRGVTCF